MHLINGQIMVPLKDLVDLWPNGTPPLREKGYFELLDDDGRRAVITRLAALNNHRDGASAEKLANELNIAVSGFYALASRFRREPSITSLIPGLRPRRGRARGETVTQDMIAEIRNLVTSRKQWPREKVLEHIQVRHEKPPAAATLRPLIDRALLDDEREHLGTKNGFGRRILVCSCPMVFRFPSANGSEAAAIAALVFDLATGMCLSDATSIDGDEAISIACERAADFIAKIDFDERHIEAPILEIQPFGAADTMMFRVISLRELGVAVDTNSLRERSSSTRVIELLGSTLGPLHFHPRMDQATFALKQLESVDVAEFLEAILQDELERKGIRAASDRMIAGASMGVVEQALRKLA
ncbi:MAG: helix-turn-helix domain-containing protein [Pseudomonadota bacterium]|nr:helix-turn-helix domain-containing protein [Pseudomonadota bacterium]